MKKVITSFILITTILFLVSCNKNKYEYIEDKVNITATTNIMGDLAKSIGGNYVSVYNLMDAGVDPHGYVPRPGDYQALNKADIILLNGLFLEAKMVEIFNEYQKNKPVINLGEELLNSDFKSRLIESEDFGGFYDPHFWFDIPLYKEAAKIFAEKLITYDKDNELYYLNNLNEYLLSLDTLNEDILVLLESLGNIPRILISAHDAFSYLSLEYEFSVYALQGLSTEDKISPSDIKEISDIVIKNNVKAVFPETSVPVETITALKESIESNNDGYKIIIGNNLYSDSMGNSDDDNTYIKMFYKNIKTIVSAFLEGEV